MTIRIVDFDKAESNLDLLHHQKHTREWRALCWQALHAVQPERRLAILAELSQLLRGDVLECGSVSIDLRRAEVTRDNMPIYLTHLEFQLLRYLIDRAGTPVSRLELLRCVWGYESATATRTVEVHVHHLRCKLEQSVRQPKLIVTVPRLGYKFDGVSWGST